MKRKRITEIAVVIVALFFSAWASAVDKTGQTEGEPFAGAKWIAMEEDSTILFPHIHLLKMKSEKGKSLKQYRLPVLERQFKLNKGEIKRATAAVCGMGQYELFVNGEKVGKNFLDPGWTMYNKRLLYNEFDVTDMLREAKGRNVTIRVMIGGGMYDIPTEGYHKFAGSCGAPKMIMAMTIEYKNGKKQTIVSDEAWTAEESPIKYSSIFGGESYDATYEGRKRPVVITRPQWEAQIDKQEEHTRLTVKKELPMRKIEGSNIYDMGQNCSGIVRLTVRGKKGSRVIMKPAEILKDGAVYQRCMPGYTWTYTIGGGKKGKKGETWQPQFTYTGFRYVEVVTEGEVENIELTGLHTSAAVEEAGSFESSDTLLNQIYTLIDWAISSNLASITTDCPTREKLGWQEQNHLMGFSMMYRYDVRELMNKIADDLADSQHEDGAIPTIAPEYTVFASGSGFEDTPEWGASFILCPYYTYVWYGDDTAMRKHYGAMEKYMAYLESRSKDGILDYGLGDWFDIGPKRPGVAQLTSVALTATAMYYYELTTMSEIAKILGKEADAEKYRKTGEEVKKAYNAKFWNEERGQYENGSQTATAMTLYMRLCDGEEWKKGEKEGENMKGRRERVLKSLVGEIESRTDTAKAGQAIVTAGDVGYRYVLQALREGGQDETIWRMNRRDDIPGYAYQLRKGATALTESWQAYDNVSNNHLMLGHLMEWIFQSPGGIRQAEGSVGWKEIVIEPQMVGNMTWAKARHRTPRGEVECKWEASEDRKTWRVEVRVPEGSEAEVRTPDGNSRRVGGGEYTFVSWRKR